MTPEELKMKVAWAVKTNSDGKVHLPSIDAAIRVVLEAAAEVAAKRYEFWDEDDAIPVECDITACEDIAMAIQSLMPEDKK